MNLLRFCKNLYRTRSKFRDFLNDASLSVFEEHPGHNDIIIQKSNTNSELDKVILDNMKSYGFRRCDFIYKNRTISFYQEMYSNVYSIVSVNLCKKKDFIKVNKIVEYFRLTPISVTFTSTPGTYHKK